MDPYATLLSSAGQPLQMVVNVSPRLGLLRLQSKGVLSKQKVHRFRKEAEKQANRKVKMPKIVYMSVHTNAKEVLLFLAVIIFAFVESHTVEERHHFLHTWFRYTA